MSKASIHSTQAPEAIGPYSQACCSGKLIFTSGQLGLDPQTGEMVHGIKEQTRQAMKNLGAILQAAGSSYDGVIKTTCFLADISDFAAFNEVYAEFFGGAATPARSCFAVVALPKGGIVEVEAVALLP